MIAFSLKMLGEIRGFEADVHIDDDVQPIFKKAYQVPFAIRDRIKAQLQRSVYRCQVE